MAVMFWAAWHAGGDAERTTRRSATKECLAVRTPETGIVRLAPGDSSRRFWYME
jgi:hypothetical protein